MVVVIIVIVAANSHSSQTGSSFSQAGGQPLPTDTGGVTSSPPQTSAGIVQFGQGVQADPRAVAVGNTLNEYFNGINTGNYQSSLSVEDPAGPLHMGNASEVHRFEQGVQTTEDSQIVLVSLGPADTASPATSAAVTFQSTQQPGYGPAGNPDQTCTNWSLTYVLTLGSDGGYLIHDVESASDQGC